jgi:hypothetical protein
MWASLVIGIGTGNAIVIKVDFGVAGAGERCRGATPIPNPAFP